MGKRGNPIRLRSFGTRMSKDQVYDAPSQVSAEHGNVVVEGPDSVAVHMTPEAAAETSHRLLGGAVEAQGQRVRKRLRDTIDRISDTIDGIPSRHDPGSS
jgi:hypothetical protein